VATRRIRESYARGGHGTRVSYFLGRAGAPDGYATRYAIRSHGDGADSLSYDFLPFPHTAYRDGNKLRLYSTSYAPASTTTRQLAEVWPQVSEWILTLLCLCRIKKASTLDDRGMFDDSSCNSILSMRLQNSLEVRNSCFMQCPTQIAS
jgi:hypothetical protein